METQLKRIAGTGDEAGRAHFVRSSAASTRAVHSGERVKGGKKARATLDALATPIVQSSTFTFRTTWAVRQPDHTRRRGEADRPRDRRAGGAGHRHRCVGVGFGHERGDHHVVGAVHRRGDAVGGGGGRGRLHHHHHRLLSPHPTVYGGDVAATARACGGDRSVRRAAAGGSGAGYTGVAQPAHRPTASGVLQRVADQPAVAAGGRAAGGFRVPGARGAGVCG
eukprot:ctg_687.g221